jgi:vacuolar-type H+-ATPase subunit E/Vma4
MLFILPNTTMGGVSVLSAGGVIVFAENGRIQCNNTLDARLVSTYKACLPEVSH